MARGFTIVLLLASVSFASAAEVCAYPCPLVRWGVKTFSQQTVDRFTAQQTPGQVAACRKCLDVPAHSPRR